MQVFKIRGWANLNFASATEEGWRCTVQAGMMQQQTGEFAAGVAADTGYGGSRCGRDGDAGLGLGWLRRIYCC